MLQILEGVQALLTEPNIEDAAQEAAYYSYKQNKLKYRE